MATAVVDDRALRQRHELDGGHQHVGDSVARRGQCAGEPPRAVVVEEAPAPGMTPAMRKFDDGHIVFNRVEMWNPDDDNSGVCD